MSRVPKRLRPSFGHTYIYMLTRGRGWTSRTLGHLHTASIFCRSHGDVSLWGPGISVCESSVFLPTTLYVLWVSVGAGLMDLRCYLIFFKIGNKHTSERERETETFGQNVGHVQEISKFQIDPLGDHLCTCSLGCQKGTRLSG